MKLLYFTLGTSLLDPLVREQLIRIPEVLSEIRKVKLQSKLQSQDPVMAFLGLNDITCATLKGSLEEWVAVVQRGLFLRLRKSGFKYSGLIKRSRMDKTLSLESALIPILQSKSEIEIYVVGPGFDDLKAKIDKLQKSIKSACLVEYFDIISLDSKLSWFWDEILKPLPVRETFSENDLTRH